MSACLASHLPAGSHRLLFPACCGQRVIFHFCGRPPASCLLQPVPEGLRLRLGFADPSAVEVFTLSLADKSLRGLIKLQFTGPHPPESPIQRVVGGNGVGGAGLRTCLSSKFLGAADTAGSRIFRQFENYTSTVSFIK